MFKSKAKKPTEDTKPDNFALAYSMSKKKKKMADGGEVKNTPSPDLHEAADKTMKDVTTGIDSRVKERQAQGKPGYAHGGMIPESDLDKHATSIADAILKQRRMAEGGMVDLEANSEEVGRSPYDEENAEAGNAEQYDDGQISPQPEDSNTHGDALDDADAHSMVEKIRAKLRAKRS